MNNDDMRGTRATQRFTQARGGDLQPFRRTSVRDDFIEGEIVANSDSTFRGNGGNFHLVIDSSGSMAGKQEILASNLNETRDGLARTLPEVSVTTTMFNNSISSRVCRASDLQQFSVAALRDGFCGGTRLNDALAHSVTGSNGSVSERTGILVFTDGGECSSSMSDSDLAVLVKAALAKGTSIRVVGVFTTNRDEKTVKDWAERVGIPYGSLATFVATTPAATMHATSVGMQKATSALIRHIQGH
jgi:hypothetical protein